MMGTAQERNRVLAEYCPDVNGVLLRALRTAESSSGMAWRGIHLLDIPTHRNVGDTAIYRGELALLQQVGWPILSQGSAVGYNRQYLRESVESAPPGSVALLLHGGGNFGDNWPFMHRFRLRVLNDFPGVPILQLPQSINFSQEETYRQTKDALERHGRFFLFVRDRESFALGESLLPAGRVFLTPDAAFGLGPLRSPVKASRRFAALLRTDKEAPAGQENILGALRAYEPDIEAEDWMASRTWQDRLEQKLDHVGIRAESLWPSLGSSVAKDLASRIRLRRGLSLLGAGETLVVDRLHAVILGMLMGRNVYFADTPQGKVGNYYRTWIEGKIPWARPWTGQLEKESGT